ncbi:scy1 protein kinase [Plasmopara halstedii]|uniref:Scy1 protein kinase n=1 Tax=Plasmopara halstedii TaxID=4781 RepID=A0A0P1B5R1_PLAHL|nr:scy1 protein kinase [Plasmopara halstedii]CEG49390.1 scy1 protein kinase [Plasmopara halstedii]|eukprot:XP_024585759.1 scy1 protein kinase [Plasmopara halstedii]
MLNRFSSAVQTAVSGAASVAVSGAQNLQGILSEEYLKHYETPKDCTASGGHELSWKIFPAVHRKTNHDYSVFLFDKDDLKRIKNKDVQDRVLEILRQEMKTLRLLRHPHVLKVEEVFEESRRSLCFVTERITCSLANACKNFTNITNVTPEVLEIGLSEFELACGLMHVGEALSFLHREGRRVHLSLGPSSIFITPKGEWKLGGMGFCRVVEPGQTSRSEYYSIDASTGVRNPATGAIEGSSEPPLQYCAPELVTEPRQFDSKADMFSLGLLIYELFVPPRADGGRNPVLDVHDGNKMTHGYKVQSLHPIAFPRSIPTALQNTIRSLLSLEPAKRLEARTFLASPFFDSGPIKTLRSLQSLVEQEPAAQAKFLTTLPDAIDGFSPRVLRDMVLPGLQSVVINKAVAPFVITPLLKIVAKVDKQTFSYSIAAMMVPLLAIKEPVQCMLMFVSELETLIPKAEEGYIRDHVVPMLCRALDSTVPEILDTVLNKIVDQASLFEYRILKQVILPRVNKLILTPPQPSVRINALLWLAKSFHVFDKDLLIESVLPTLQQTLHEDKTPAACMCILGCYDNLGKHLGPEFIAKLIIPAVAPLLWEQTLTNSQFDLVCEKMQDMLKAVISDRDKSFTSQSSVGTVTTGITAASGLSNVVRAAEVSKERESGVAAANKLLSEDYVPKKKQDPKASQNQRPDRYSDDPYHLGSSSSSTMQGNRTERRDSGSRRESASERAESFSARRRAGKKGNVKSSRRVGKTDDGNADILGLNAGTTKSSPTSQDFPNTGDLLTVMPPAAPAMNYTGGNGLFNGSGIGSNGQTQSGDFRHSQQTIGMQVNSLNQQQGMVPYGQNLGIGINNQQQYNPNMMQMTPYGLQQQAPINDSYAQPSMGLAGPGQMLQIQAPYAPQQSRDKFSAFDGL